MQLLDHLKSTGESVDAFAHRVGEPLSTIRKIAYRQRQPSLPLAVKIERATDGSVSAADMILVDDIAGRDGAFQDGTSPGKPDHVSVGCGA